MTPGEKLPSRPSLSNEYATTRATLDKAIAELESEGYLTSKLGSGTYIADLSGRTIQNISTWGIIVPNVMEELYPGLVRGVENYAQKIGVNIVLCNSDNSSSKQEQYLRRLIASGVTGIILVPVITCAVKQLLRLYDQLAETNIPFVFCNRSIEGINVPVIASNDFYGGYIATKHLLEQGFRKPVYLARVKYKTSVDRCQGYLSALLENDIPINRKLIIFGDEASTAYGYSYDVVNRLLDSGQEFDSIFCFDDSLSSGCYQALGERGIRIPENCGIIGYNNTNICESLEPKLTSVAFKNVEIGNKAAEILWKRINHEELTGFEYYLFQPSIVVRSSTNNIG